jgi:hypothetical protein
LRRGPTHAILRNSKLSILRWKREIKHAVRDALMIVPAKASSQRRFFFLISERGESGAKKIGERRPLPHNASGGDEQRAKGRHYRECGIYEKRVLQVVICTPFYATSRPHNVEKAELTAARVFLSPSGAENDERPCPPKKVNMPRAACAFPDVCFVCCAAFPTDNTKGLRNIRCALRTKII